MVWSGFECLDAFSRAGVHRSERLQSFALVARAGVAYLLSRTGGVVYVPPTPTPKFRNDQPRRLVVHCLGVGVGVPNTIYRVEMSDVRGGATRVWEQGSPRREHFGVCGAGR